MRRSSIFGSARLRQVCGRPHRACGQRMSVRSVERALTRMAASACVLAPYRDGYGLYPNADRRRRPSVRLTSDEVRALASAGAIAARGDAFVLSDAGRARARRNEALPDEAFAAQHRPVVARSVMREDGLVMSARGHDADAAMRRLAALKDANGAPWLSAAELGAASALRATWLASERGMVSASDWAAPPMSGQTRGAGNGREAALAAHCDARRRLATALDTLAPALRRVVERVCLQEEGLEALERAESWPARSGKLALKLALAQLARA